MRLRSVLRRILTASERPAMPLHSMLRVCSHSSRDCPMMKVTHIIYLPERVHREALKGKLLNADEAIYGDSPGLPPCRKQCCRALGIGRLGCNLRAGPSLNSQPRLDVGNFVMRVTYLQLIQGDEHGYGCGHRGVGGRAAMNFTRYGFHTEA
jgi:hypothetical protein